jgi:histone H3/H4
VLVTSVSTVACSALQDALLALSEGAKVFIQYLTAAANAVCKGAGRQTLSEDDVYAALADIQFAEFVPPLQEAAKGETSLLA